MTRAGLVVGAALICGSLAAAPSGAALGSSPPPAFPKTTFLSGVVAIAPDDVWTVGKDADRAISKHWDGSSWSDVSVPVPDGNSTLNGVAADAAGDVWAVGYVIGPDPGVVAVIEHGDGSTWTLVPCPNPGQYGTYLTDVSADSATDAWAVGYYFDDPNKGVIEHWNGETWQLVDRRFRDDLTGVSAVAPDDVWVSGWASGAGLLEHWNGARWVRISTDAPGFFGGVSTAARDEVMVVGDAGANTVYNHIIHGEVFGGTTVNPGESNYLYDVDAAASHDFWAVGSFQGSGPRGVRPLVEHFLDGRWSRSRPVGFDGHASKFSAVSGDSPHDIWAVGEHFMHSRSSYPLVEHYDGSAWNIVLQ
jgi:hypothetical protein